MQGQRVAVYARFSTDKQNPRSIEDQLRVCRDYIERAGGRIADDLVFADVALSGTTSARPGLQALLAAVEAGTVDVVVTEDLSRIGRDVGINDRVLKSMRSHGARLLAINDGIDSRQESAKLLGTIRSAMAEGYIDDIKRRTRRGMDGLFGAGMSTGGKTYGYRSVPAGDGTGRMRMEIDPEQAAVVLRVFGWYVGGVGIRMIAQRLNQSAVASPRGRKWSHTTVNAMLANDIYQGVVFFNKRMYERDSATGKRGKAMRSRADWLRDERPELRIVDAVTWDRAATKRADTRKVYAQGKRPKQGYPLSGLLLCDVCGDLMTVGGGAAGRRYYFCGAYRKGHGCSNTQSIPEQSLRRWVVDQIRDTAGAPKLLEAMRAAWASSLGTKDRELKAEVTQRRAALARTEAQISALLDFVADGNATPSTLAKVKDKEDYAELQRATIVRLSAELGAVPTIPSLDQMRDFLRALPEAVQLRPVESRQLLRELIRGGEIRCRPAGHEGYHLAFSLVPGALLGIGIAPSAVAGAMPSGSCGGAILPLGIMADVLVSGTCPTVYGASGA
jgi:site-specific DNA recombinase